MSLAGLSGAWNCLHPAVLLKHYTDALPATYSVQLGDYDSTPGMVVDIYTFGVQNSFTY